MVVVVLHDPALCDFFPWPNSAPVIYFCTRSLGSVLSRQDFLLRRDVLLPASQKTHQPPQAALFAIRGLRLAGVSCCNAAEFVSELPLGKYLQSFYSLACRRSKRGIYQTGSWLSVSFPARRTAPLPRPSVLFSSNSQQSSFYHTGDASARLAITCWHFRRLGWSQPAKKNKTKHVLLGSWLCFVENKERRWSSLCMI